jgi:peptidylprolyl isomerase
MKGVLAWRIMVQQPIAASFLLRTLLHHWLDGKHTIFGHVVEEGMNVVNLIEQNDYINKVTIIRREAAKV